MEGNFYVPDGWNCLVLEDQICSLETLCDEILVCFYRGVTFHQFPEANCGQITTPMKHKTLLSFSNDFSQT